MNLKNIIKEEVLSYIENQEVELTDAQLQTVINGVEYYISEAMSESISTSVFSVMNYYE